MVFQRKLGSWNPNQSTCLERSVAVPRGSWICVYLYRIQDRSRGSSGREDFRDGWKRLENAAHRARNHEIFVRSNHANRGPAGIRGNHARRFGIARLAQFHAKEAQSLADARADAWRIFANTSSEDERVHAAQRSRESADPFFRLIAAQRH